MSFSPYVFACLKRIAEKRLHLPLLAAIALVFSSAATLAHDLEAHNHHHHHELVHEHHEDDDEAPEACFTCLSAAMVKARPAAVVSACLSPVEPFGVAPLARCLAAPPQVTPSTTNPRAPPVSL
jgi:hypothetical protein